MTLRIYNTLSRTKEDFRPLDPANVRMYVCGPTVYDFAHIGNARPAIVFDVLFRLLRYLYGEAHVTYVRNITDVDDKINARALRDYPGVPLNDAIRKVTETTYQQYQKDVTALGCLPPTVQPRATEHIKGMTEMISTLIKRGHAYEAAGEVLFDVASMPDYGRLSQRKLEDQQAGARIAVEAHKKNPGDFVLWKQSTPEEPGWDSPWGRGRPGWHIECSVMSKAHLGEVFDIHGGGLDLIFPHHENEIAQSRCAHGTDVMARYWMHNGFLQVEGQKMSKSLGNFHTIDSLLQLWPGDTLRHQMLQTHYREPIDWTESRCSLATSELEDWAHVLEGYWSFSTENTQIDPRLVDALSDDLNTPLAMSVLRELFAKAKKGLMENVLPFAKAVQFMGFKRLGEPGLFQQSVSGTNVGPDALNEAYDAIRKVRAQYSNTASTITFSPSPELSDFFKGKSYEYKVKQGGYIELVGKDVEFTTRIQALVAARLEARKAKNFAESDRIRDELLALGILIKDVKDKATGEIKTEWEVRR